MNTVKKYKIPEKNVVISSYDDRFRNGSLPIACVIEEPKRKRTERFVSREEINSVVEYFLKRDEIHMAAYFIFELNVGYRVGDCLAFRKCDVMEKERPLHMKSQLTLIETKTRKNNKYRTVYFNKAITEVLAYLVKNKRDEDYLFIPDKKPQFRLEIMGYKPMARQTAYNNIKRAVEDLEIDMHVGTHSFRKTFDYFMAVGQEEHIDLNLACRALGHSDSRITSRHYLNTPERIIKARMLELNLGLEAWEKYFSESD